MSEGAPQIKMDVNKFYSVARKDIKELIKGAGIGSAVIYNATNQPVTFYAYNYIDIVYAVDAAHTKVAPGYYGAVSASGTKFKINPDKNVDDQFEVEPGKAYVYEGPGAVSPV